MARTAKTLVRIQNAGVFLGASFDTLNLGLNLTGTDQGSGVAGIAAAGGASGTNIATEVLAASQSGSNALLTLSGLAHPFVAVEVVFRNGQSITPITSWTLSAGVITVFNADASEIFMIQYTY